MKTSIKEEQDRLINLAQELPLIDCSKYGHFNRRTVGTWLDWDSLMEIWPLIRSRLFTVATVEDELLLSEFKGYMAEKYLYSFDEWEAPVGISSEVLRQFHDNEHTFLSSIYWQIEARYTDSRYFKFLEINEGFGDGTKRVAHCFAQDIGTIFELLCSDLKLNYGFSISKFTYAPDDVIMPKDCHRERYGLSPKPIGQRRLTKAADRQRHISSYKALGLDIEYNKNGTPFLTEQSLASVLGLEANHD